MQYDLNLVPTDTLLIELQKRFAIVIFAGVKVMTKNQYATVIRFNPKELTTLGLAEMLKTKVRQAIDSESSWQTEIDQDKI